MLQRDHMACCGYALRVRGLCHNGADKRDMKLKFGFKVDVNMSKERFEGYHSTFLT